MVLELGHVHRRVDQLGEGPRVEGFPNVDVDLGIVDARIPFHLVTDVVGETQERFRHSRHAPKLSGIDVFLELHIADCPLAGDIDTNPDRIGPIDQQHAPGKLIGLTVPSRWSRIQKVSERKQELEREVGAQPPQHHLATQAPRCFANRLRRRRRGGLAFAAAHESSRARQQFLRPVGIEENRRGKQHEPGEGPDRPEEVIGHVEERERDQREHAGLAPQQGEADQQIEEQSPIAEEVRGSGRFEQGA